MYSERGSFGASSYDKNTTSIFPEKTGFSKGGELNIKKEISQLNKHILFIIELFIIIIDKNIFILKRNNILSQYTFPRILSHSRLVNI
jgi:methyl coenzyme M reductase subunit C